MSTARRVMRPEAVVIAALHAKPGSPLWELMVEEESTRLRSEPFFDPTMTVEETIRTKREYALEPKKTVAEDLGRDDIPQAFVDAVKRTEVDNVFCSLDRRNSQEACMRFMLDGGPDKRWLNVPAPFSPSCHAEPQEDEESDEDDSEPDMLGVKDELVVEVQDLSIGA